MPQLRPILVADRLRTKIEADVNAHPDVVWALAHARLSQRDYPRVRWEIWLDTEATEWLRNYMGDLRDECMRIGGRNYIQYWPVRVKAELAAAKGALRRLDKSHLPDRCDLTPLEVLVIVNARACEIPLSTGAIVDMCQAAYPDREGITNREIARILDKLDQVECFHSIRDRETLEEYGAEGLDRYPPHVFRYYWLFVSDLDLI